jgi:HNH endonuclease
MTMPPTRIRVFWSRTRMDGECLLWTAGKVPGGYGAFFVGGKNVMAHRVAWTIAHGPIADGMVIRHSCDRPACVRPSHLIAGTQRDNMADKYERGRACHPRGSAHFRAKLTDDAVLAIRNAVAAGESVATVAARHGVTVANVRLVASGRTWRHVGGPRTVLSTAVTP